jgi:hypothetical protein
MSITATSGPIGALGFVGPAEAAMGRLLGFDE